MIKDIVVNLGVGGKHEAAINYAVSVAAAFEAHIAGLAFAYEPVVPATVAGGIAVDFIAVQRAESQRAATAAVARFEQAASRDGLSFASHVIDATLAGAAELFGEIGRRFDLSVVGQTQPDDPIASDLVIEAALFESGRPVIVVPYIQREGLKLDQVLVCWDGSRTAARAIGDAMPFLSRAKAVEVVTVANDPGKSDEVPAADMGAHLARHGLKVEVKRLVAVDIDVTSAILSHAADISADFMVMGGYGHSRLREFILGGATRGILGAMTLPVLMSH